MDTAAAKKLFFDYEGSGFHMWHDGVLPSFEEANIPREVQAAWLEELIQLRLGRLDQDGNFDVLRFLIDRCNFAHIAAVAQAIPRGTFLERCWFLEYRLAYADGARKVGQEESSVRSAYARTLAEAEKLVKRAWSQYSLDRIQTIITRAQQALDTSETEGTET